MYNDLPLTDDVLHLSTVAVDPVTYMPHPAILDAEQLLIRVFAVFRVRIPCDDVLELCCMTLTFFIVMLLWALLVIPTPAPVNPQSIVCPFPSKTISFAATLNAVVFANTFSVNTYVVPAEFKL
ncbi:hypothetical protein BGV40_08580 [Methanosarcina sp. Ant1]|jgi:hypothetical protein|nr:hypothetical protein BGV40_08580 [Methanosarcina sp. Ant1]